MVRHWQTTNHGKTADRDALKKRMYVLRFLQKPGGATIEEFTEKLREKIAAYEISRLLNE